MANSKYGEDLNAPPQYSSRPYEPLKEEMEFQNCSGLSVQSTVVTIMPEGPPIRDHIIWSLFNTMYLNFCCLGLLAFVFSVKSRDRKLHGDKNSAQSYGTTARSLNIAATALSILSLVVVIIIFIIQMEKIAEDARRYSSMENNLYG